MQPEIILPTVPAMQTCYDTLQQEMAALWQRFQEELLAAANAASPPEERLQVVLGRAGAVWSQFLEEDSAGLAMVAERAWLCCLGDLAEALVRQALAAARSSDEPPTQRQERLAALRGLLKQELSQAPNFLMMDLDIQAALYELQGSS